MDLANELVEADGYLVGVVPANVARDGKALGNQPLALRFAPLNDLDPLLASAGCSVVVAYDQEGAWSQ